MLCIWLLIDSLSGMWRDRDLVTWTALGGYLGQCLLGMCRWPVRAPTPLSSMMWPIRGAILVTFRKICNFRDPKLITFYFYELTHILDWLRNTLLFIYSTNSLVRLLTVNMKNFLAPKNPKMCDPIIGQSGHENATPSSGTSPLASHKEVPPPLPPAGLNRSRV